MNQARGGDKSLRLPAGVFSSISVSASRRFLSRCWPHVVFSVAASAGLSLPVMCGCFASVGLMRRCPHHHANPLSAVERHAGLWRRRRQGTARRQRPAAVHGPIPAQPPRLLSAPITLPQPSLPCRVDVRAKGGEGTGNTALSSLGAGRYKNVKNKEQASETNLPCPPSLGFLPSDRCTMFLFSSVWGLLLDLELRDMGSIADPVLRSGSATQHAPLSLSRTHARTNTRGSKWLR